MNDFLLTAWKWNIAAAGLSASMMIGYAMAVRPVRLKLVTCFFGATTMLLLALVSPLGVLAQYYLFSAHMLQHLILLLIVPSLLLLSLPQRAESANRIVRPRDGKCSQWLGKWLSATPLAWLAGVGAMWLWHAPTLCSAAGTSTPVRHLQTGSLLLMGTLFWWPLLRPRVQARLAPLPAIIYLFTACLACSLLGIYITFTPLTVCSVYVHPVDPFGILPILRNDLGLTPAADQHLGGLIMWVPACLIYLTGIIGQLSRWYAEHEQLPSNRPERPAVLPHPGASLKNP